MAIRLTKDGDKHIFNLGKGNSPQGEIVINLTWNQGGFLRSLIGKSIDLDLGCYYELRSGERTVIDGLQFSHNRGGRRNERTRQGYYTASPYIWHSGDDRGGSSSSGENILVNPVGISEIKRIIVYTFIYEGAARWEETNAIVRVSVPRVGEVMVEMGKQSSSQAFCAIAQIEFSNSGEVSVERLVSFHGGHSDCDRRYGWGLQWSPGSK